MAITVLESPLGRKSGLKKASRQYVIKGATDEGSALVALLASCASVVNGMALTPSDCDVEEIVSQGTSYYTGTASYAAPGDPSAQKAGSFSIAFDISGQTVHYNQALNHIAHFTRSGSPTRLYKGAINVDESGTVNGIDVIVPTTTITINYTVDPALITDAYVATLAKLVGSVNDAPFKEFDTGELLLTRVSGSQRDYESWDLCFGLSVSGNQSDFYVGAFDSDAGIHVDSKKGWDYLWCSYETHTDDVNKVTVKQVSQVNIEQVYPYKSYDALGLP